MPEHFLLFLSPGEAFCGDVLLMGVDLRSDEVVYQEHSRELVRFATGIVGPDDAPDVVADAFLRLAASAVWSEAGDRRALWFRAVTFEARSLQRSATRRRARETSVAAATATTVTSSPTLDDERVDSALDVLSVQQRAVVVLTYWQDLRPAEVGDLLGVAEGSVRKQLARARRKLRGVLR